MNELLLKSESNNNASILLLSKQLYNSAVHCAYYSCLQYIIHVLKEKNKWSDDDIQTKIDSFNEGSHNFYIKKIDSIINNRKFNTLITQLKLIRVNADYKSFLINEEDCLKSLTYKDSILQMLKLIKI